MAPKTLRLAHPELCDGCSDLLQTGTRVYVDASCHVTCMACARTAHRLIQHDPWSVVANPELRDRLHHRSSQVHHAA